MHTGSLYSCVKSCSSIMHVAHVLAINVAVVAIMIGVQNADASEKHVTPSSRQPKHACRYLFMGGLKWDASCLEAGMRTAYCVDETRTWWKRLGDCETSQCHACFLCCLVLRPSHTELRLQES